jgi:MinD-like ATPase involved in chromosome partitioning or flagellar assembly|tara:strand:+ start:2921 stop:3601 length:681 start_codon:yes stop_codon:yes gene_type:complete
MNIGLIGKGYWGTILLSKLEKIGNVKFICNSKDNYKTKLDLVDWVFIATPNDTHFDIVKHCILSEKNIFCEKPLTPTYEQSLKLFTLANKHGVKLYVNDVFNWRNETINLKSLLNPKNNLKVTWRKESSNKLFDLLYHDLYLLYPLLKSKLDIKWPQINNIIFDYEGSDKTHTINNIDFTHSKNSNDALLEMVENVLNNKVDYDYNQMITLFCNKTIDDISNNPNL